MNRDEGGPAFPETRYGGNTNRHPVDTEPGMTLRDWFAGQALAGLAVGIVDDMTKGATAADSMRAIKGMPTIAYLMADGMIAARAKP